MGEKASFSNQHKAQFWYEWGNEPIGYKSVGYYDKQDVFHGLPPMKIEDVAKLGLPFHNPHS